MVLDGGMEYQAISANAGQSQLLESRKFTVSEIARIYRVPPHMIQDLERSTNNNIEHQGLEFVVFTMIPWIVRFEQEYNDKLFKEKDKSEYFIRFNVQSLQRGDTVSRTQMYVQAIQNGWMSPNETRQMEGMNKREGGDIYLTPMNMTTKPDEGTDEKK
jgi:HK97 family phage portal protein